ncbi:MAG: bifunctional phosphopantothenoylcysteine decarboxylase/phosphopantothenate--cysteine ligase CoaBC [Magnetococcales bacterium]|nr:bifunctional phosphopantothenoylcysteine decarboxylase/phosphopantothenate--cysteine ligase CoaBC [Magnetococcales bacterium]NGZ28377.1 bifunctional phosphopantothenoylcysteine decarboxylase/phosphopantothenate--cysteine ligase CoaBC [Magnetococcales bacterium]
MECKDLSFWRDKKIVVGIGGGIAAYKTLDLLRLLQGEGAKVTVVPTPAALHFITPLSMQALANGPVYSDLFSLVGEAEMGHIRLAREADLVIVAPATADLLARMAMGQGDDLLSTLLLARQGPVLVAPAMNHAMWHHPATRRNVATLQGDGIHFIGPESGPLACGEVGEGRMAPVETLLEAARRVLLPKPWRGKKIVVTAGPTREALDPVRFISNHSSGRMGYAVAQAILRAGGEVVYVHGPLEVPPPMGCQCVAVTSAAEMLEATLGVWPQCQAAILTAAVGDFKPVISGSEKIKKENLSPQGLSLQLTTTVDILATLSQNRRSDQVVVGFAAETGELLTKAVAKLRRKGCDLLVANDVSEPGSGFATTTNRVTLLWPDGRQQPLPMMSKEEVGDHLLAAITPLWMAKSGENGS